MRRWYLGRDYIETCGMLRQNIIKQVHVDADGMNHNKKYINFKEGGMVSEKSNAQIGEKTGNLFMIS